MIASTTDTARTINQRANQTKNSGWTARSLFPSTGTPDSSTKGSVMAINRSQTPPAPCKSTEDSMDECRVFQSTHIATYSTKMALEAGVPNKFLRIKEKQDDDNAQPTPNNNIQDFPVHKSDIKPIPSYASAVLYPTNEDAQRKTHAERRLERAFSGPMDPEYARILGSATFNNTPDRDISTGTAFMESPTIKKEDKACSDPSDADEDVAEIIRDWNIKYRHDHNIGPKLIHNSRDSGYKRILSSEAALSPVIGTVRSQQVSAHKPDDEYHSIFRRHEFSFQHIDEYHHTISDSVIQPAKRTHRPSRSRPSGYIDSENILRSLSRPSTSQRTAPDRKSVQEEETIRLYEGISQRDQQAWQERQRMMPSVAEPLPLTNYSHAPVKSNSQLVKLGIKTVPEGIPIWIEVSRSAPLGEMFVTAVRSDDALRGYAFMLPDRFVRWDDTPHEVRDVNAFCGTNANWICSFISKTRIAL
jgi:hypothetical protein